MKANPKAARRLYNALIKHTPIPTNDFVGDKRVFLVPVKQIARREAKYAAYRNARKARQFAGHYFSSLGGQMRHAGKMVSKTNTFRNIIRRKRGHLIPPISLVSVPPEYQYKYPFEVVDGHHRLSAHQAEGKRFIRATIKQGERFD